MAVKIIRFCTADQVTDSMPINNDVDSDTLKKTIWIAQEQHVQNSLGSNLYKEFKRLVDTGDIDLPGKVEYKTLLDEYIIPVLFRYSYYRSIRTFSSQFTDKGVQNRSGEASQRAPENNVHALRQDALNDAEFHEKLLKKYICDKGAGVFPEYFDCNPEDIRPKSESSFNGIVHSRKRVETDRERIERLS